MTLSNKNEAIEYAKHGFALCLVNGKKPFQNEWESKPVTDFELFNKWGIGLIHGLSGTCTLDIDDIDKTRIALKSVDIDLDALMNESVRLESGRPNRTKLVFYAPDFEIKRHALNWPNESDKKLKEVVFELRGGNTQDVLPPSIHPDTLQPYYWVGDWQNITPLPEQLANLWQNWQIAEPILKSACPYLIDEKPDLKAINAPVRIFKGGDDDVIGAFNAKMDLVGLLSNYGYKQVTTKRLLSPHSTTKLAGCVLTNDRDVQTVFIHHASDPLGDGYRHTAFSVYCYYQHNNDVKNAVREAALLLDMDYKAPEVNLDDVKLGENVADIFLTKTSNVLEIKPPPPPPKNTLPLPILNELADWLRGHVGTAPKNAITQAVLSFACVMSSRSVRLKDGTSPASFLAIVSDSAGQVQGLKGALNDAIATCGDRKIIRGTKITSSSCIHKHLLNTPRMFWATDDHAVMINFGRKQQSGAIMGALSAINDVYTNNTLYLDKDVLGNFAKDKGDDDVNSFDVYRPCLTLLSMMSTSQIDHIAQRDQYSAGALQRLVIADGGDTVKCERCYDVPLPQSIITMVRAIRTNYNVGNLSNVFDVANMKPQEKIAQFDCDNTSLLFSNQLTRIRNACEGNEARADLLGIAHGWAGSFKRLCVALGAFNDCIINESIINWCANWIYYHLDILLTRLEVRGIDSVDATLCEQVHQIIIESGTIGASSRDICQRSRVWRKSSTGEKIEVLERLQADGFVICKKIGKSERFYDVRKISVAK